ADQRKALLEAAAKHADVAPLDLLRLAVFGTDVDRSREARKALTGVDSPMATELIADALRVPMDAAERDALLSTLARLGASSPLARWLSVVHRGLGGRAGALEAGATLAPYYAGDVAAAYERAPAAAKAIPAGDGSWASMAVLTIFAEGRFKAIKKSVKEKTDFPPEWLTDVHSAYSMLLRHPLGTEDQVLWHQDLLDWLGAKDAS